MKLQLRCEGRALRHSANVDPTDSVIRSWWRAGLCVTDAVREKPVRRQISADRRHRCSRAIQTRANQPLPLCEAAVYAYSFWSAALPVCETS
jgi:hypothetical protein